MVISAVGPEALFFDRKALDGLGCLKYMNIADAVFFQAFEGLP